MGGAAMNKSIAKGAVCAMAAFVIAAFVMMPVAHAALPEYPADKVVEQDLKAHWPADSKIIELKKAGEWTNQMVINEDGRKVPQPYISYNVRSEKDGTVHKAQASVRYILAEGTWLFKAVGLGEFKAEARADRVAPAKPDVKEMIKKAVEANKFEDFGALYFMAQDPLKVPLKVNKVLITDPEYLDSGDTYGFKYLFDVEVVDAKNRKAVVTDMSYTITKSSAGTGDWKERMGNTGMGKGKYIQ